MLCENVIPSGLKLRKCLVQKMERAKGFEPSTQNSQPVVVQSFSEPVESDHTQIRAQILDKDKRNLAQVVNAWPELPAAFKAAILAIVKSNEKEGR